MKISILQFNQTWASPQANILRLDDLLGSRTDADVIVLPEMFSTGFCVEPEGIAEQPDGLSLQWMRHKAAELQCAIAGSLSVVEDGTFRNRFYFIRPDDGPVYYDKHHLFSYGGENNYYAAGKERVIVTFRGVRFLLQVCYDLRFPVFSRNRNDYDVALYVASWPHGRIAAWQALLRARAIENQSFVVGVNRVGTDPVCRYSGGSGVFDAYGNRLAACRDDEEELITIELNMAELAEFRTKFPVLADLDDFEIK